MKNNNKENALTRCGNLKTNQTPLFAFLVEKCPICEKELENKARFIWNTDNGFIRGVKMCEKGYRKIFGGCE